MTDKRFLCASAENKLIVEQLHLAEPYGYKVLDCISFQTIHFRQKCICTVIYTRTDGRDATFEGCNLTYSEEGRMDLIVSWVQEQCICSKQPFFKQRLTLSVYLYMHIYLFVRGLVLMYTLTNVHCDTIQMQWRCTTFVLSF